MPRLRAYRRPTLRALVAYRPAPALCAAGLGVVLAVPDGDGLTVRLDAEVLTVRLFGIDAPEIGQPHGAAARAALAALALGATVTLQRLDIDAHGRTVALAVTAHGLSLSHELCAAGNAWHLAQMAPRMLSLAALEQHARRHRLGLWADERPIPPWAWRRGAR